MNSERQIIEQRGLGRLELWPLPTDENTLWMLLMDVFEGYWQDIRFGTMVPGGVWEIRAPNAPTRVSLMDGYVTVDFGAWHFHICVGHFSGCEPTLAAERRTGRAELYRLLDREDAPKSWGLRLYNQLGDQQLTVFLPNPFLDPGGWRALAPDWERLRAWDTLRQSYLGLAPDPVDRSGQGFVCGG
ncbi:hypothetical protein DBR47_22560 [Paucibacter sp. KBW04]|uniref:DUF7676 family protein n=1 Tax=Paucibacter sp. KBW04 TaxID=2153361 RepID=UPI000F565BA8|nr:hypothetical protein [Paucibacter sp. KBW04]RQO54432.1 hypothetical protein DBR47_22560 [Paucibacter sp. KBW04]